jgi:hypothetical protein
VRSTGPAQRRWRIKVPEGSNERHDCRNREGKGGDGIDGIKINIPAEPMIAGAIGAALVVVDTGSTGGSFPLLRHCPSELLK